MNSYDVVVVGGRVAGASTALLLARAGVRVALLDRGRHGTDIVSTHGLMRAGVLQLSRWGILPAIRAAGTPPVRRTTFHYEGGHSVQVSIRPSAGVDALYAPRRHVLDRILVDAAADAGAHVLHETVVDGLVRDDLGRVAGVRTSGAHGSAELRARFVVGADGIGSYVARAVGAPVVRQGQNATAVLYRYLADLPADGYEWSYGRHAGAGLIPTNDGQTCVFVGTTPARMRPLRRQGRDAAFVELMRASGPALLERVQAATPASPFHGWGGVPGHLRRAWGPGWALVGDAGYFKDPISTHGMTDALRDAELLADALLEILLGSVPEAVALGHYERTRDRLSTALFEVTEAVAAYDWDAESIQGLLRGMSSAMSDEVDHLMTRPTRPDVPGPESVQVPLGPDRVPMPR
jgi:flavin-dependent dehydrogenase